MKSVSRIVLSSVCKLSSWFRRLFASSKSLCFLSCLLTKSRFLKQQQNLSTILVYKDCKQEQLALVFDPSRFLSNFSDYSLLSSPFSSESSSWVLCKLSSSSGTQRKILLMREERNLCASQPESMNVIIIQRRAAQPPISPKTLLSDLTTHFSLTRYLL